MLDKTVGVVVIGRNEGERLKKCLHSLIGNVSSIVYVDSGSTDGSVEFVRNLGIDIIALDLSIPFTAARARNEGAKLLINKFPTIQFIQFIDGDCELIDGWLNSAIEAFNEDVAVVFGLLKERYPEASVFNAMAEEAWHIEAGYTETSGGIAMIRVSDFQLARGYDPSLIAGEEPDLCLRLRRSGRKILSIPVQMALHDSDIHRFSQWFKRALRTGHAFAEISWKHRKFPERYWVRHNLSIFVWGIGLPLCIFIASTIHIAFLACLLVYPLQAYRIAINEGWKYRHAYYCTLVKFPQAFGQLKFFISNVFGRRSTLIEYK